MKIHLIFILVILVSFEVPGQTVSESLTAELTNHFTSSSIPGFSVALVNNDKILFQKGFGLADKRENKNFEVTTVQNLGSVSKTVVGLALVKAIEDGKLTMDTEINEILPFEVVNPYFPQEPILVRHLANHTSSILDTKNYGKSYVLDTGFTPSKNVHQDYLAFLKSHENISLKTFLFNIVNEKGEWYRKKNFLKNKPGLNKEYANLNAALTAYLIEIATKTSFEEYTQEKIFTPLSMTSTVWKVDDSLQSQLATPYFPQGAEVPRYQLITFPDGGLYSSAADLAIFLREMIKAYSGNSNYLMPEYAKLLLPDDKDANRAYWGMGVKSRNIGHGGSDPGVQNDLQFNADSKIGRIIMANVNVEDNEELWKQYRKIHEILGKYEQKLNN